MSADLATAIMSMQAGRTQQSATLAVMRKSHEMDQAVVDMLNASLRNTAPPAAPGTGSVIDKTA